MIRNHAKSGVNGAPPDPLFLYLAWQSVHSGGNLQLQAPQSYVDGFTDTVENPLRRHFAGMVRALDEGVGNVTEALEEAWMLQDSLSIFLTLTLTLIVVWDAR